MKTRLLLSLSGLSFLGLLFNYAVSPTHVYAQKPEEWEVLQTPGKPCVLEGDVATIQGLECLFINVTRVLTPIVGITLFIMLVIGALKYLTSAGDPKKTQSAQQTLTWAIAGVVIFFGIWFVLQLIKAITGVDVTIFKIPN